MPDPLTSGRLAFEDHAWGDAYARLAEAARTAALEPEDLMRLAMAAALTGHDDESTDVLARTYQECLSRDEVATAARCALWLGMRLQFLGEPIRGSGWLARARRILDETGRDCAEQGYVLVPLGRQMTEEGDVASAVATFEQALNIGRRFGEPDLIALAQLGLGDCRLRLGRLTDGLAVLDEVMVSVESREVSPLIAGILYCAVINLCYEVYDLRRAQAWTDALTRWCSAQPDLVPFRGQCEVHRAQILQLHGAWPAAMDIAESVATERGLRSTQPAKGAAFYQKAELHRLRGEFSRAEDAYRQASRLGFAPEPGLAQMRVAQRQMQSASATIGRALDQATRPLVRSRLLPAYVEIALAGGDVAAARRGVQELASLASDFGSPFLLACAEHAAGALMLSEGDARGALTDLHEASLAWQQLDAPYEAARTRELAGLACRALGDEDRARLELDAAAWAFRHLGAAPDASRVAGYLRRTLSKASEDAAGLTRREVEVLRLLAAGKTNRAIASELVLSDKTVARHVSNIFTKLGLSSRSAATAYAYERDLV